MRAREAQGRQQVVGGAVRELEQEVGRAGRDEDGVGIAREVDVRHVVGDAAVPLVRVDAAPGQGLHRDGADEVGGRFRHHDLHVRALLDEGAAQFRRLVAGHAAGQAEDDLLALQVHAHEILRSANALIWFCSRGAVRPR